MNYYKKEDSMNYVPTIAKLVSCAVIAFSASFASGQATIDKPKVESAETATEVFPASDQENKGGWVLREDISDEFEGSEIDKSKWFVEGENGEYYIWKGRAPSQFAPHNVLVEDGKLKLRSRWEPDYEFAQDEGHEGNTYRVHDGKDFPVTTAGVITRKRFLNGYMEVKSKSGDAAMTSSFWAIGYESELDIYETMGRPNAGDDIKDNSVKMSVHDWQPPAKRPTRRFGYKKQMPFRVADDYHVYGCEWGEDYIKCFIDGELVYETTQKKEGKNWVLTNPMEVWLDSEIFVWLGLPNKEELPVDFEVEYLRVWQKPNSNLLDRAFFSFEGPYLFQDQTRPLTLVPENSENNDYQKFWEISEESSENLAVVRHEKSSKGTRSLKFAQKGALVAEQVSVKSPNGTVNLESGDYVLSLDIWVDANNKAKSLTAALADPQTEVKFDIPTRPIGEWVTLTKKISRSESSSEKDHLTLSLQKQDCPDGDSWFYIDNISISKPGESSKAVKTLPTDKNLEDWIELEKVKWKKHGWKWDQSLVEKAFATMDTNSDGIATGIERKVYFEELMKTKAENNK